MSAVRAFGLAADGRPVHAVTLAWPGGLEAEVLDYGAILHRLRFPAAEGMRDATLRRPRLEDYERDTAYVGAVVGRVANRIAGGRFPLDGRDVRVSANEGSNTLHGGRVGFNKRSWRFETVAADGRSLRLVYDSPDGEEGFPGLARVEVRFALVAADNLEIGYGATASAPTPLALSHHLYFNLSGREGSTILDHRLQIAAQRFTPVGEGQIPTGEVAPVGGTPFDLREARRIGEVVEGSDPQIALGGGGLDLNWALDPGAHPGLVLTATDGARLELATDQPGVQVYSGQKLPSPFVRHGALAVEPQDFPDAVNHPNFPSVILRPGETYRRTSRYRLRA